MKKQTAGAAPSIDNIYRLDGKVPVAKAIPFGLQHVLAMFVANVAPIILVAQVAVYNGIAFTEIETARLIQNAMLIAGIGTLIQLYPIWRIGSKLPVVMGISFTFVSAMMVYAAQDYGIMIGGIIVGGCIEGVLGLTVKYWRRFVAPIVSACVVTTIGFSLLSVGINSYGASNAYDFGSWQNLLVGTITLVTCLVYQALAKGFWKQLYVLAGLVVGYIAAICFGMVDFAQIGSTVSELGVVSFPQLLHFTPKFELGAIVSITLVFFVSAAETIGDTTAVCNGGLGRRRVRLLSHHILQPECRPGRDDKGRQPLHDHVRCACARAGRSVPAHRRILLHAARMRARRLHRYDVRRNHRLRRYHAEPVRSGPAQYADRRHLSLHRHRRHAGLRLL